MKLISVVVSSMLIASGTFAAEKTKATAIAVASAPVALGTTVVPAKTAQNTLAFNFVGLSQGKTNIYFDVGGLSERVSPSLSYRAYSNEEKRKNFDNQKLTVDRNLATVGASIKLVEVKGKSLLLNPYLFFGTESDMENTSTKNGVGVRLVGQANLNKVMALQAGIDGNTMEDTFKSDIYIGVAFTL